MFRIFYFIFFTEKQDKIPSTFDYHMNITVYECGDYIVAWYQSTMVLLYYSITNIL